MARQGEPLSREKFKMTSVSIRRAAVTIAVGISALLTAGQAAAATNPTTPFGCRASTARVTLGSSTILEPLIANPKTAPCANDQHGLSDVNVTQTNNSFLNAGPADVVTHSVYSPSDAVAPGAAAVSDVQGVTIPSSSGDITIVGPVESNASYACVNGALTSSAGSTLDVIYVNGQKTTLPSPGAPDTIQLGGGSYIALNEKITTSDSITERVLDVHLQGLASIVVGEAEVTLTRSDPCAGTNNNTPPPNTNACPQGSTLDAARNVCIITLPGGKIIVVGPPFTGPTGGKVEAVSVARKRYKSPCLNGPGPKYALIATKKHGRVTGTPRSDRILAIGAYERIAALGGNDCVDGRGSTQTIWDGNGKDRIFGGTGKTRIGVGNGNSRIEGRKGRDWITAGNGNDWIWGGSHASRIDAGLGRDHVYGGHDANRVFVAGGHSFVSCGSGKGNLAFLRRGTMKYASRHGCERIVMLH
jgi:Ca2+-binding RTX toxin-like protein